MNNTNTRKNKAEQWFIEHKNTSHFEAVDNFEAKVICEYLSVSGIFNFHDGKHVVYNRDIRAFAIIRRAIGAAGF